MEVKDSISIKERVLRLLQSIKGGVKGVFGVLRRHPHIARLAVVNTIAVLIITYWVHSWVYSFGGDLKVGLWIERIKMARSTIDHVPDSIVFVNVAYDKVLREHKPRLDDSSDECIDRSRVAVGTQTMTDRAKLLSFFNILDSVDYRYILLDVRFEKGFEEDSISYALYNKIIRRDRIVIAKHSKGEYVDTLIPPKMAMADYHTTLMEAGLVKFPTIEKQGLTIPGRMYKELHGGDIKRHCWALYTDRGRLCYGSYFLTYPVRVTRWKPGSVNSNGNYVYGAPLYDNLGSDILNSENPINFKDKFGGKIIVVGDMVGDMHETYIGTLPGPVVNVNGYLALARGSHLVNWWWILFIGMVYAAISLAIFAHKSVFEYIPRINKSKSTLTRFIVSFLGYSTLLTALSYLYYIFAGEFYSVATPALYFSILSAIVRYIDIKNHKL